MMPALCSLALVFVVVNPLWDALDDNAYWIAVTTGDIACFVQFLSPSGCYLPAVSHSADSFTCVLAQPLPWSPMWDQLFSKEHKGLLVLPLVLAWA